MSYDALRHFADSWGLVLMGVIYTILTGWLFLPRSRDRSVDAAQSIFEADGGEGDHG